MVYEQTLCEFWVATSIFYFSAVQFHFGSCCTAIQKKGSLNFILVDVARPFRKKEA
jgi:hypothetical protein